MARVKARHDMRRGFAVTKSLITLLLGVIWRAMARYDVLLRVFFRLRHSFLLFIMSFQIGDTSIVVFVNFLLLVIDLTLLKSSYI